MLKVRNVIVKAYYLKFKRCFFLNFGQLIDWLPERPKNQKGRKTRKVVDQKGIIL